MTTWLKVSDVMFGMVEVLRTEWGCEASDDNQRFSANDEAECDVWCDRLARNLSAPIDPPIRLRSLILRRLVFAGGFAKSLSAQGQGPIEEFGAALVRDLLIPIWHRQSVYNN